MIAPGPGPAPTYTSSSLYVGELAPDVSEAMLFEIFNVVGPVASIRVCRDAMLKRSLGYAYVNFHNQSDAERALETMNYTVINNRPCRIMWSQRDPTLRKSGVGNIFVKSLHPNVQHKELQECFSLFGDILSCKVALDVEGKSKGYGYVHFATEEAAKAAIERMGEIEILGTKVDVQAFQKKTNPQRTVAWTNLYAKNVPAHMSEADIRDMFSKFGEVLSLKLMVFSDDDAAKDAMSPKPRGIRSGSSKGFAFINFGTHEHALAACEGLNGTKLADPESVKARHMAKARVDAGEAGVDAPEQEAPIKMLYVGRAQKKEERLRELKKVFQQLREKNQQSLLGVNLFVKNLEDNMDDKALDAAFKVFGNITSSRVMRGMDGASRGFGFVCFSTPEEATQASNEMNGKVINGKPVYVALAQRREQRREMLSQMQMAPRGPPGGNRGPMPGNMYGALPMQMFPQHMGNRGYNNMMPMMGGGKGMPRGQMNYQQRMPQYPIQQQYQQMQMGPGQQMQQQQQQRGPRGPRQENRRGGPGMPQMHGGMQQQQQQQHMGQMGQMMNNGQGGPQGQPRGMRQQPMMQGQPQQRQPQQQQPQQQQPQFNAKARNQPSAIPTGPAPVIAEAQVASGGPAPLTTSMLAAADEGMQKNMIGERLYPLIANTQPELAGKITGMLLEMDNSELLHLLESAEALDSKITEALDVLRAHQISTNN